MAHFDIGLGVIDVGDLEGSVAVARESSIQIRDELAHLIGGARTTAFESLVVLVGELDLGTKGVVTGRDDTLELALPNQLPIHRSPALLDQRLILLLDDLVHQRKAPD